MITVECDDKTELLITQHLSLTGCMHLPRPHHLILMITSHDNPRLCLFTNPKKTPAHITHIDISFHLNLLRPSETLWFCMAWQWYNFFYHLFSLPIMEIRKNLCNVIAPEVHIFWRPKLHQKSGNVVEMVLVAKKCQKFAFKLELWLF